MRDYKKIYDTWCENNFLDENTKNELQKIKNNDNEIKECFYKDLEFGTAGLRGIMGSGTNRMNIYTVRKSTQGLANYIKKQNAQKRGVAIAFDCRNNSIEFAKEAALILCANNIKTYIFDSLRPTPMLSFAIRYLNCIAGINITASHNPPEYNGYKVYWEDGAQITPPHDIGIIEEVNAITDLFSLKRADEEQAKKEGLYNIISSKVDDEYIEILKKQIKHMDAIRNFASQIKIVYSPLHGTGNIWVRRILKELGFNNVYVVKEQELPDGNFPTVSYPNPEDKEAFKLGLKLATDIDADLVLATDPDADRLGVYVKDKNGKFHTLTGNMSGCLLAEYEISGLKEQGLLKHNSSLIKSIVSSNMANEIAKNYDIQLVEVLTGFKYIGRKMLEFEKENTGHYAFGFEESYGCLIGDYARDKDAISATMALCEAACYYKQKNMTLWDAMIDLYEKYGYYMEDTISISLQGIEGLQKIQDIMQSLRNMEILNIGKYKILEKRDYKLSESINYEIDKKSIIDMDKSNVLYYKLNDNSWICARPSGTEPKLKLYISVKGKNEKEVLDNMEYLKIKIKEIVAI